MSRKVAPQMRDESVFAGMKLTVGIRKLVLGSDRQVLERVDGQKPGSSRPLCYRAFENSGVSACSNRAKRANGLFGLFGAAIDEVL